MKTIKKIYHYFFHSWEESGWNTEGVDVTRKCTVCGKEQVLVDYDLGGGIVGSSYLWEDKK